MQKITFVFYLAFTMFLLPQYLIAQEQKLDSVQTSSWNNTLGWQLTIRQHNIEDTENSTHTSTSSNKIGSPDLWENSTRQIITYDSEKRIIDMTNQYALADFWINSYLFHYEYDENGNNDELVFSNYINNNWEISWRYLYNYDVNNQITETIFQTYNGSMYANYERIISTYNGNEIANEETTYQWNVSIWNTIPFSRVVRTFEGDLLKEELQQNYDIGGWLNNSRLTSMNNGILIYEFIQETWDSVNDMWQKEIKGAYTFDINNNFDEVTIYEWIDTKWENQTKFKYFWNSSLSILENGDNELKVFPNPTKDYINISLNKPLEFNSELKIFNLQGSMISNTPLVKGTQHILSSIKHFSKGLYILKITSSSSEKTFKIIRE